MGHLVLPPIDFANDECYPDSGSLVIDLSGNGHYAGIDGAYYVNEHGGGIKSYGRLYKSNIIVGQHHTYNGIKIFTLEAWVKSGIATGRSSHSTHRIQYIFSNTRNCCGNYKGYNLRINNMDIEFILWNRSARNRLLTNNAMINTNDIAHVSATYDGVTQKIYVNGRLNTQVDLLNGIATPANADLHIGQLALGGYHWFSSTITFYQNRIYNRALSAEEVLQNFNTHKNRFGK